MIHVALDLGSESMAAYYDDPASGKSGMIKLQAEAKDLVLDIAPGGSIDYLYDQTANGRANLPSARLWNRISLVDGAQPVDPPVEHAKMILSDPANSQKSLFQYFRTTGSWARDLRKMPNPKILFQHQIKEILPTTVQAVPDGHVNLTPELIVKHLSLQVILNFVLNSNELKSADRNNILLTITVPNVYSLPHAESLRSFIKDYAGVGDVQILSESDAVAYFVLTMDDVNDPQELKDLKGEMERIFKKKKKLCLVTLDIGKGTTDLSCVLVEEPRDGNAVHTGFLASLFGVKDGVVKESSSADTRRWHSVQGKTGKCSGGNYLNYLFAHYYDRRLKAAAQVLQESLKNAYFKEVPFGFIQLSVPHRRGQGLAIYELERLIEEVKRSITEEYEIEISPERQGEILDDVVDEILQEADAQTIKDKTTARAAKQYAEFRNKLKEALTLPRRLDSSEWHSLFGSWVRPRANPQAASAAGPSSEELSTLKRQLEAYVRENVEETLDSLRNLVKEHQAVESNAEEINKMACVVVSGQGAQFNPIRRAVKTKCRELNIKENQIYMLTGVQAKEACCRGVISYRKNDTRHINPRELHGTYGCAAAGFSYEGFKAFDMTQVKMNGSHTISFASPQEYYVVFTPRSYKEVLKSPPKKNDGATAFIKLIERSSKFTLRYDENSLELWINNQKLDFAGFGDIDSSIYPKVWPEILEPTE